MNKTLIDNSSEILSMVHAIKECMNTEGINHIRIATGYWDFFMLADVVGLGKTIVGTLLIKHFLQFPDEEGREQKILIVTPPAIQSAWKRTIEEFDETSDLKIAPMIDYITTGSIGKLTDDEIDDEEDDHDTGDFNGELQQVNYGLIIIDESHKFRTSTTSMYEAIDTLIANIGSETGVYPYIGLLSATPQNNRPSDLQNQIYLFERNHAESTLKKAKGGNLKGFTCLESYCKVYSGVNPFEKGKGKPAQTVEMVKNHIYVKEGDKPEPNWMPLLRGSLMHRYVNFWNDNYWILYGENLEAPRDPKIFEADEKIIVRQTGDAIIATIIGKNIICRNNLHICVPIDKDSSLSFILGVINSKAMDFVYQFMNPEKGEALAEVKKAHVEKLPVPNATKEQQQPIISLVDQILDLKKQDPHTDTTSLETEIDRLVYELYGLTNSEVKKVFRGC